MVIALIMALDTVDQPTKVPNGPGGVADPQTAFGDLEVFLQLPGRKTTALVQGDRFQIFKQISCPSLVAANAFYFRQGELGLHDRRIRLPQHPHVDAQCLLDAGPGLIVATTSRRQPCIQHQRPGQEQRPVGLMAQLVDRVADQGFGARKAAFTEIGVGEKQAHAQVIGGTAVGCPRTDFDCLGD